MAKKKPAVRKRGPQCNCIAKFNKTLAKIGLTLDTEVILNFRHNQLSFETMKIPVVKLDPKNRKVKLRLILVTFCPICGTKYNWKTKKKET